MPGTMSQGDLVADLKASLLSAAAVFTAEASDGAFKRHLNVAALAFQAKRPRTLLGTLTLVAEQPLYAAPANLRSIKSHLWGISRLSTSKPWDKTWTGRLPDLRLIEGDTPANRKLQLSPAPTAHQINVLGAEFSYWYFANHVIADTAGNTSISDADRGLLLLRAMAEAMRELAVRNVQSPVVVRDGFGSQPRNGTPSHLYNQLLDEWSAAA